MPSYHQLETATSPINSNSYPLSFMAMRVRGGPTVTEQTRLVIGADGTHSSVARAVQASQYNTKSPLTCWYAGHWSGLLSEKVEFYLRARRAFIVAPTNDGLTVVLVGWPHRLH